MSLSTPFVDCVINYEMYLEITPSLHTSKTQYFATFLVAVVVFVVAVDVCSELPCECKVGTWSCEVIYAVQFRTSSVLWELSH